MKISRLSIEIERLNVAMKDLVDKSKNEKENLYGQIQRLNNALRLKVIESQEWQDQVNRSGELINKKYNDLQLAYQQVIEEC